MFTEVPAPLYIHDSANNLIILLLFGLWDALVVYWLKESDIAVLSMLTNMMLYDLQSSTFISLCLGFIGMDHVMKGQFYKEIIGK